MSQIISLTLEELTLGWLELQMVLSEALDHNTQATQVPFLCLQKVNHIVQISQAVSHIQFTQAALH